MNRLTLSILFCLFFLCTTAVAQPSEVNKPATAKEVAAKGKTAVDPEAERIRRERRSQAQSLLISLAADAGSFNDHKLRAPRRGSPMFFGTLMLNAKRRGPVQ